MATTRHIPPSLDWKDLNYRQFCGHSIDMSLLAGSNASEHVVSFFQSRLNEVQFLKDEVAFKGTKRPWQAGPDGPSICAKRRTRSYLSYKIPRRVKAKQLAAKLDNGEKKNLRRNKMTSIQDNRRSKRKPSLLRQHRVRSGVAGGGAEGPNPALPRWLETHRWHTKRMHMEENWGLKIGQRCMTRGRSSVGRTIKKAAVIQDISFLSLFRLHGLSMEVVKDLFAEFMDPLDVELISEDDVLNGHREQEVMLYKRSKFPRCCVGPARISLAANDAEEPEVLVWCHPASVSELLLGLRQMISEVVGGSSALSDFFTQQRNVSRFSLRGAGAQGILSQVFWPHIAEKNSSYEEHHSFFLKILKSEGMDAVWRHGGVVNVAAVDVRHLSIKGTKSQSTFITDASRPWEAVSKVEWEELALSSDLRRERKLVFPTAPGVYVSKEDGHQCKRDDEINQHRANARKMKSIGEKGLSFSRVLRKKVDIVNAMSTAEIDKIPVLFVRQSAKSWQDIPSHQTLFTGDVDSRPVKSSVELSGWDIVMPSVWSTSVWKALQFAGAVAIGLDEAESLSLECGHASFPRDFPDSDAGSEYWKNKKASFERKIKKLPKRDTPFCRNLLRSVPDYSFLFQGLNVAFGDFSLGMTVVRNSMFLQPFVPEISWEMPKRRGLPLWKRMLELVDNEKAASTEVIEPPPFPFPSMPFPTLVSVAIRSISRGSIKTGAAIYCPLQCDISSWEEHKGAKRQCGIDGGKRIGEWRGVKLLHNENERAVVGYVSSGSPSLLQTGSIGIGCCGAVQIYECLGQLCTYSRDTVARRVVLFRNPGSNYMRPAELKILASC